MQTYIEFLLPDTIPILLDLPFKHKGIMCAPFIGPISIEKYLQSGQIERVVCGGENYDGSRPCNFDCFSISSGHTDSPLLMQTYIEFLLPDTILQNGYFIIAGVL